MRRLFFYIHEMAKRLYFIAIEIPEPQKSEIQSLRVRLSRKYASFHALKSPPHITLLMPMRIDETFENIFISFFKSLDQKFESGTITLNNIASFEKRTIYIDVLPEKWIREIYNNVRKTILAQSYLINTKQRDNFHPHITLLNRDLREDVYTKAIEELNDYKIDYSLFIDKLQLYKHNGAVWEVLSELNLR